eukprot:TRINITY_DN3591_c0_g1_i3.p1 TRINITY_DN3591_c0_g1~~TRINITY_DN3591_c0_g1_i3.p1  ORF type:complete len:218 (-),score=50.87 TRINITY_DN3591_c0_g1_i3:149-802(-)
MTCCCCNRGDVQLKMRVAKNSYYQNEMIAIELDGRNDSDVQVDAVNVKLICLIRLISSVGHHHFKHNILEQVSLPAIPAHSADAKRSCQLRAQNATLPMMNTPCFEISYQLFAEYDIPWAPDLEILTPLNVCNCPAPPPPIHPAEVAAMNAPLTFAYSTGIAQLAVNGGAEEAKEEVEISVEPQQNVPPGVPPPAYTPGYSVPMNWNPRVFNDQVQL